MGEFQWGAIDMLGRSTCALQLTAAVAVRPRACSCSSVLAQHCPTLFTLAHVDACCPARITYVLVFCVSVKVREAQLAQYNYILVVGEEEKTARTVNVRTRDNVVHGMYKVCGVWVRRGEGM